MAIYTALYWKQAHGVWTDDYRSRLQTALNAQALYWWQDMPSVVLLPGRFSVQDIVGAIRLTHFDVQVWEGRTLSQILPLIRKELARESWRPA
jgi:hypothetical protein